MAAIRFLFEAILQYLLVTLFLLRVLLPLVRADSRNDFSQAVMRLSNPVVLPLRRVLPPIGKLDTASLVALLAAQMFATGILWLLDSYPWIDTAVEFVKLMLLQLIISVIFFYRFALFIYILLSWVAPNTYSPATALLQSLCNPLLRPIQRIVPPIAGIDFSALIVLLLLQAALILIGGWLNPF